MIVRYHKANTTDVIDFMDAVPSVSGLFFMDIAEF